MNASLSSGLPGASAPNSGQRSIHLGVTGKLITFLVFLYWMAYENVLFFYPMEYGGTVFFVLVNGIKLFLPLCLLVFTGLPSPRMVERGPVRLYLLFFVGFLLWGLVPTLISGDVLSWFKLLPRFVFFLSVVALFARRPVAFSLFAKCMVVYVLSALLQYVLLYVTGADDAYDSAVLTANGNNLMAGPFGLLGNVISTRLLPGAPFTFLRLFGFWNEHSNASGSAFAAFFLARYLVSTGERPFWRVASYACFVAGMLAFSNAGYFALAAALLFGLLFGARGFTTRRVFQVALLLPIVAAFLWVAFAGRSYVAENLPANVWARAITGSQPNIDPFSGRVDLMQTTLEKAAEGSIGVGIQEVGSEGITGSATAPLYWLLVTGIPGLFLILGREAVLLVSSRSLLRRLPAMLPLIQALVAVMAQHFSYGSWMNPNYLILAAMVLVCSHRSTQQPFATNGLGHG